jgi:hypothetical protein
VINFNVHYESIPTTKKEGTSIAKAKSKAIASALSDALTHVVIKILDKSIANRLGIGHLNKACTNAGLNMVKANREKRKIAISDGLVTTAGKKLSGTFTSPPPLVPAR